VYQRRALDKKQAVPYPAVIVHLYNMHAVIGWSEGGEQRLEKVARGAITSRSFDTIAKLDRWLEKLT